jgi:hypothetical protein
MHGRIVGLPISLQAQKVQEKCHKFLLLGHSQFFTWRFRLADIKVSKGSS